MESIVDPVSGVVSEPFLHDGLLYGMVSSEAGDMRLYWSSDKVDRSGYLLLTGVEHFFADSFRQSNVIGTVRITNLATSESDRIQKAIYGDHQVPIATLEQLRDNLLSNSEEWVVFSIDSSYGANIWAICRKVEFCP